MQRNEAERRAVEMFRRRGYVGAVAYEAVEVPVPNTRRKEYMVAVRVPGTGRAEVTVGEWGIVHWRFIGEGGK